jgi:diadenosine tetraphosphate (Ap4A) HIT family hydrolase
VSACIFCDILAGRAAASFVYRDERVSAFMDHHPVNPGHLLVVPNQHAGSLGALDPLDGAQLFQVAQRLAAALRQSGLPCAGVNLHLSDGAAAGQEVPHVHLHVIPRLAGDGAGMRRGPGGGQWLSAQALEEAAGKIRQVLDEGR